MQVPVLPAPVPLPPPAPEPQPEPAHGDIEHFRRLARVQGIEAAASAYTKEEMLKMARLNNFTYINPRARKIDLAHALAEFL